MDINSVGYYYLKESSTGNKKEVENKWMKANMTIIAQINRYILEIKPFTDDDDIYDEDEDERTQRSPKKLKLSDYKTCESKGFQNFNNSKIYLLSLNPKLFSTAKKVLLAFLTEENCHFWMESLEKILTHKFQIMNSSGSGTTNTECSSIASMEQFMIENDVYEGSLMPGEFLATIIETSKSKEIGLRGRYILMVTDIGLELKDEYTERIVKIWEIKIIRRFGEKDNVFTFELGKFSEDGPGALCFQVEKGKQLMKELLETKENCLKIKTNRRSVLKTSEDTMFKSNMSNSDTHLPSPPLSKMMYFSNDARLNINTEELKQSEILKKISTFEPPKVAPPPIPAENPKQTLDNAD